MSRPWAGGVQARNPIPLKIHPVCGIVVQSIILKGTNVLQLVWCERLERGLPAQKSSESHLTAAQNYVVHPNSHRVASKRDFNVSKLNKSFPRCVLFSIFFSIIFPPNSGIIK
ncbi:hypothetical protein AVEN_196110-1 [Araneus ventricosus]|uniref:Uncharacterized protein n=1 Tax=Araneus ventricosus TaxID=182803 RepID=A0A4Y2HKB3_ARAVE|nr:hypothetical protein AVEN_196110-1 [Araneus ventricosus]